MNRRMTRKVKREEKKTGVGLLGEVGCVLREMSRSGVVEAGGLEVGGWRVSSIWAHAWKTVPQDSALSKQPNGQ